MQFTGIATIAGTVLAGAGLAAAAAMLYFPRNDPGAQVWFDYPVAARQVFTGDLTVTSHTDIAGVIVDSAGPSIVVERDALTPVLVLAVDLGD